MNDFGRQAKDHWAQWLPNRYGQLENPDRFFNLLGEQVANQIEELLAATPDPDLPAGPQLDAWWATVRANATNQVLAELVLLAPEDPQVETPADPLSPNAIAHETMMAGFEDEENEAHRNQLR